MTRVRAFTAAPSSLGVFVILVRSSSLVDPHSISGLRPYHSGSHSCEVGRSMNSENRGVSVTRDRTCRASLRVISEIGPVYRGHK